MSAIGKVRIAGRSLPAARISVSLESAPRLLPVSRSPSGLDAILRSLRTIPSAAHILPAKSPLELQPALASSHGVRADVILLDLRDLRPSVAYRLVARIRSSGWNGCLVIAVAEHELGLVPMAKRFGATDFVLPSMSAAELAVRLFAVDVRTEAKSGPVPLDPSGSSKGDVALEWRTHELVSGSMRAQLTLRELQLLEVLLARKGMTTTTAELAQLAWGKSSKAGRTLAATYVCSLRKKLAWFGGQFGVRTIRGVGYRFELVAR